MAVGGVGNAVTYVVGELGAPQPDDAAETPHRQPRSTRRARRPRIPHASRSGNRLHRSCTYASVVVSAVALGALVVGRPLPQQRLASGRPIGRAALPPRHSPRWSPTHAGGCRSGAPAPPVEKNWAAIAPVWRRPQRPINNTAATATGGDAGGCASNRPSAVLFDGRHPHGGRTTPDTGGECARGTVGRVGRLPAKKGQAGRFREPARPEPAPPPPPPHRRATSAPFAIDRRVRTPAWPCAPAGGMEGGRWANDADRRKGRRGGSYDGTAEVYIGRIPASTGR